MEALLPLIEIVGRLLWPKLDRQRDMGIPLIPVRTTMNEPS
jgi:hypothetical protein